MRHNKLRKEREDHLAKAQAIFERAMDRHVGLTKELPTKQVVVAGDKELPTDLTFEWGSGPIDA